MSRLILPFLLAFSLVPATGLAAPAVAPSKPSTWAVHVSGDGPCARAPEFAASLAAEVPEEKRPIEGAAPDLVAEVQMVSTVKATVEVREGSGLQTLGARDIALAGSGCSSAAETISFVLGVLFQSDHGFAPEPEPEPEPEPPPQTPPTPPQPRPPARSARKFGERHAWLGPRPAHEISASVGGLLGLLPGVPVGGRLAWTIRGASTWPATLWASGWKSTTTAIAKSRFGAAFGGVSACPLHAEGQYIQWRTCADLGAGAAWAESRDTNLYGRHKWREPFVLVGLSGNAAARLIGPLFIELSVQADTALPNRDFSIIRLDNKRQTIFRTSWVVGSAFLGLSLRFR